MPARHGPPDVAQPLDTDQIKRPKKRGTGTRRPKAKHLQPLEAASTETPPPPTDTSPPEPLNSPASSLPSVSSNPSGSTVDDPSSVVSPLTPTSAPISGTNNPPKPGAESSPPGGVITVGGIDFHHASEAEFARLLNYYGIEWLYEPNQFPLQWRDGRPVEMFSPDFYLVEYDLYIELTTMRQSLVRRKNRKLRLLRALYPEINIKLLYRRDYNRLLERFGIRPEEIEAELPGYGSPVAVAEEE
ncbi:MAG: hypothetical protein ABI670_10835 [Chloroflexota bacterium]